MAEVRSSGGDLPVKSGVFQLLEEVLKVLLEEGALSDGSGGKVVDWRHPEELKVSSVFLA